MQVDKKQKDRHWVSSVVISQQIMVSRLSIINSCVTDTDFSDTDFTDTVGAKINKTLQSNQIPLKTFPCWGDFVKWKIYLTTYKIFKNVEFEF